MRWTVKAAAIKANASVDMSTSAIYQRSNNKDVYCYNQAIYIINLSQSSRVIFPTERYCYFENLRLTAVSLYLFYSFSKMQSYL